MYRIIQHTLFHSPLSDESVTPTCNLLPVSVFFHPSPLTHYCTGSLIENRQNGPFEVPERGNAYLSCQANNSTVSLFFFLPKKVTPFTLSSLLFHLRPERPVRREQKRCQGLSTVKWKESVLELVDRFLERDEMDDECA